MVKRISSIEPYFCALKRKSPIKSNSGALKSVASDTKRDLLKCPEEAYEEGLYIGTSGEILT